MPFRTLMYLPQIQNLQQQILDRDNP